MNLNHRFIRDLQRALIRRQPMSGEYVPSRRIEDAMVPSEDSRDFRDLLIVIDQYMSTQAAQYLFENMASATKKGNVGLYNTKFVIVTWDDGGLGAFKHCHGSSRLLQLMTEMYSQSANAGSLDALFQELLKRFSVVEQIIILTDGRFNKLIGTELLSSRIRKKTIIAIADSQLNSCGNLNIDYGIPPNIPVIRLDAQDSVASQD